MLILPLLLRNVGQGGRGSISSVRSLTTKYSMVYREKDACPEKKDFLQNKGGAQNQPV